MKNLRKTKNNPKVHANPDLKNFLNSSEKERNSNKKPNQSDYQRNPFGLTRINLLPLCLRINEIILAIIFINHFLILSNSNSLLIFFFALPHRKITGKKCFKKKKKRSSSRLKCTDLSTLPKMQCVNEICSKIWPKKFEIKRDSR